VSKPRLAIDAHGTLAHGDLDEDGSCLRGDVYETRAGWRWSARREWLVGHLDEPSTVRAEAAPTTAAPSEAAARAALLAWCEARLCAVPHCARAINTRTTRDGQCARCREREDCE